MDMQFNGAKPLIALFDSGIGGLNLLKVCVKKIPQADFCYVADNFNVPYGNLPAGEIKRLAFAAFDKIAKLNPAAAAVACNTVTAECIKDLRARYSFPIAGVQPAVKQAADLGGRFLVLTTVATAHSPSFKSLLYRYGKNAVVKECPSLAAGIEKNIFDLQNFFPAEAFVKGEFSSVVLGCTHYIFVADKIKNYYGVPVFDGMVGTADHLGEISGIFDHQTNSHPNVSFISGDFDKNRTIFENIYQ
ncbi:MAG: aspartate/glutamate racemase family protein [Clostridia bacterium]|nr:aspartate/glutamate racemase family protein [Clostridia bacterium]